MKGKQVVINVPLALHRESAAEGKLTKEGTRKVLERAVADLYASRQEAARYRTVLENLLEKAKAPSMMDAEDTVSFLRQVLRGG